MASRDDYRDELVSAARSVLIELIHLLGEYQQDIVLIGGWVPEFLIPQHEEKHVGSIDVDLALNHRNIDPAGYRTIIDLVLSRGYRQGKQPFTFFRHVPSPGRDIVVEVDFLAGEYGGTGKKHRTQSVQGIHPRKARGADLVFDNPILISLHGNLPGGGEDVVDVQVAPIPSFIIMKSMALKSRLKEKDAWDIYYCIRYYPGGIDALVNDFTPFMNHGLLTEAVMYLAQAFVSPNAVGPKHVADFEEIIDFEDRELVQRDAFERIQLFLQRLDLLK